MDFANQLWAQSLRCDSVFSESKLKALYTEELLPSNRDQVRNYLTNNSPQGLPKTRLERPRHWENAQGIT